MTHKWACVFWLNLTTAAPAQADLQTLAAKISSGFNTSVVPQITIDTTMNSVSLVWTPTAGFELIASDTTTRTGAVGTAGMTNAASCFVVNHRTGAYYRGGHSRSYLPGVASVDVTNGSTISAGKAGQVATAWASWVTGIKTGAVGAISAVDVGVVRFSSKGMWLVPPVFYPWVSHSVRLTLGTQRGRLTE